MEQGRVHHLPVGRELFVDERGLGLRATWHLDHGFVNIAGPTTSLLDDAG